MREKGIVRKASETVAYNLLKWVIVSILIITGVSIPIVFLKRGDAWGRVFTTAWILLLGASLAWLGTKGLGFMWDRRKKKR